MLASIGPGATTHHLDRRVKSPQSLARKFDQQLRGRVAPRDVYDVLRFTALTAHADHLVGMTRDTVDALTERGWRVGTAIQSYVDGSRYKGLHVNMVHTSGQLVEVQFHSAASVRIKDATTRLYHVERDRSHSSGQRRQAREECVRLSATLDQPAGLNRLTDLDGVPVTVRAFGAPAPGQGRRETVAGSAEATARLEASSSRNNDGMGR